MNLKTTLLSLIFIFATVNSFAQEYELLVVKKNKTIEIERNKNVRISYPAKKLGFKGKREIVGLRGKIDSIGKENIWIKTKAGKTNPLKLNVEDIIALKKSSSACLISSFVVTYAVIAGGTIWASQSADINPTVTTLLAGASIFPSLYITTGVLYPAKPRKKVGEHYKLEIVEVK